MRSCFKVVYFGDDNFDHFRYVLAADAKDARRHMKRLPCDHIYTVVKTRNPLCFLIAKLCERFGGKSDASWPDPSFDPIRDPRL